MVPNCPLAGVLTGLVAPAVAAIETQEAAAEKARHKAETANLKAEKLRLADEERDLKERVDAQSSADDEGKTGEGPTTATELKKSKKKQAKKNNLKG